MAFEVTAQNVSALEPLFKPWEQPTKHRRPNPKKGQPAIVALGRRPSKLPTVVNIRAEVDAWRRGGYVGVSNTSRRLLEHWFENEHLVNNEHGELVPFRYHWVQREAIETFIYLYEIRHVRNVAELLLEFGGNQSANIAYGILPEQDRWAKYCAKVATGAGKTKIMSLAIVWSYFHSIYEPDSDLAQHFVIIAPNLIVYERLKEDFKNCAIFYQDPLIPDEWRNDFQMEVVLQDEFVSAVTTGVIYLTNIHRLYSSRDNVADEAVSRVTDIFGPSILRDKALYNSKELRSRISLHPRLIVLNDEAHHLHDPELAWNRAIEALHDESLSHGNQGICAQFDFTATPKHNDGSFFRHIVVDFPLGEAVDAGIVKVPVLGESNQLVVHGDKKTPADKRYAMHLQLGYQRYAQTYEELHRVRKPILFIMTQDAKSADEIAAYLDSDAFPLLKGRVLNIHTRLKGKLKKVKRGGKSFEEFVENETAMKPEDLRVLREMSRELDSPDSKFRCVVSVMMLREGWDVRNVTTIVPLRPYSARSGILPEQTIGRGLRRMFPLGETLESVSVIEHPAFRKLYEDELAQEELEIAALEISLAFKQTVTIFVDYEHKDVNTLEIEIPLVSDAIQTKKVFQGLSFETVREAFQAKFQPLPIGQKRKGTIEYEERHLFTDEIVTIMKLDAGLLNKAWSAPAYFAQMLGHACRLSNPHPVLAPLLERFIAELLFERPVNLYNGEVDHRMHDVDVIEYIRATFTPLILQNMVSKKERTSTGCTQRLSTWKPYQATTHDRRPAVQAQRTMFNLVPCDNDFEKAFTDFLESTQNVIAFAKNAGPQKLMIDYLQPHGQRAFYVPDFFVRTQEGTYYLVELKGRQDELVSLKASAAVEWCKAASSERVSWKYLFVPYDLFQQGTATEINELARACEPTLKALLKEWHIKQHNLFCEEAKSKNQQEELFKQTLKELGILEPPSQLAHLMRQAVIVLDEAARSKHPTLALAFQPLLGPLDEYALRLLEKYVKPSIPADEKALNAFFSPNLDCLPENKRSHFEKNQGNLKSNLISGRPIQRLGTLLFCLNYAQESGQQILGIWQIIRQQFSNPTFSKLYKDLQDINKFRNTHVAHVEKPLTNEEEAWEAMKKWLRVLQMMAQLCE